MYLKRAQFCRLAAAFCLLLPGTYAFAADVFTLYPERPILTAANDDKENGLMFQAYHVNVGDFKVGDLVLSKSNFLGEVLAIQGDKLFVEGRFLGGRYSPRDFVKETRSIRGIQVGSHIKDGAGNWGRLTRAWEDGRIEISGKWYASYPFHIDRMKIAEVVPPKPRSANPIVRFCEDVMKLW